MPTRLRSQYTMDSITKYIQSGQKHRQTGGIGLEVEHFILNQTTGMPMPYDEIEELFSIIQKDYSKLVYEKGHVVSLENEETLITLEPGCQLEVSFLYTSDLEKIEKAYQKAMNPIRAIVEEKGYQIVYSGGLPTVSVDAFKRIHKERYAYMEAYFENHGTRGKEMMKGTAAVHVSIDYADEADYIKKYRVANILHPILAFLCFNTPYYAGKENKDILLRDSIWKETDADRCRIVDDLFAESFSYQSYANYVWKVPLILMHQGDEFISVGNKSCEEVAKVYGSDTEAIQHYLSMVFPNIRTKNFIEIRSADCMPLAYTMAYCALIKGLFYQEENLKKYGELVHSIEEIEIACQEIRQKDWQAKVYGKDIVSFCYNLIEDAKLGLNTQEKKRLDVFFSLIEKKKHIGEL